MKDLISSSYWLETPEGGGGGVAACFHRLTEHSFFYWMSWQTASIEWNKYFMFDDNAACLYWLEQIFDDMAACLYWLEQIFDDMSACCYWLEQICDDMSACCYWLEQIFDDMAAWFY